MASPLSLYSCFFIIFTWYFTAIRSQKSVYMVHMDMSVMPRAFSDYENWFSVTLSSIKDSFKNGDIIYSYRNVMHGFAASLTESELEMLKRSHGFVSAIKDKPLVRDTTHSSEFLNLVPTSGAWAKANFGKDVIIGVIDTGIWPESASFRDNGFSEIPSRWKGTCEEGTNFSSSLCNKKLIGARYFNKALLSTTPNLIIPMNSPRDTDGHGTHTTSTAGGVSVNDASYFGYANGTAIGMAPNARVAMYKVSWSEGDSVADTIAGIDQAISDGVDVISISLGVDDVTLYEDPIAIASFAAMEKGIAFVTSAGNRGPDLGTLHNGIPWVVTVGASTIDREFAGIFTLGNGVSIKGSSLYIGNYFSLKQVPIVFTEACNYTKLLQILGNKIVVCEDNEGILSRIGPFNATGAVIIITNHTSSSIKFTYPAAYVTLEDGKTVTDYIKNTENPYASLEFRQTILGKRPAPSVPAYSARGPSLSCPSVLKPDIIAPGTLILAAWSKDSPIGFTGRGIEFSDFNIISGTSMSCPHVAGIAALVKATHSDWSTAAIRSALMTTAYTFDNMNEPIKDSSDSYKPASPLAMGAGHIDPNKAIDPGLIYDADEQDYINLLCAMNFTKEQIQTITRNPSYNCSSSKFIPDLNYPSFIAFFSANTSTATATKWVKKFQRTVTNVGVGAAIYNAKFTSTDGLSIRVEPEKLIFREQNEKQSFIVTLEIKGNTRDEVKQGSLIWIEEEGEHVVRSPVAVVVFG